MKLLRFGTLGKERPGLLDTSNNIRDLSSVIDDINPLNLGEDRLHLIREIDENTLPLAPINTRIGACVGNVGKFICIGLNYADHAAETGARIPSEPEVFSKATTAISGANDVVIRPLNSQKLDWEVELAIVIGKKASYVSEANALQHIAGYCVCNDISERNFQLERGQQWDKGKGCDTFGPIGPWLVTKDEITKPDQLDMWLEVNGHRYQHGNTNTMVFKPNFLVSYLSSFMRLEPGDIISTGTPPGVGLGQNPPVFLQPNDVITLGITGLGQQRQIVKDYNSQQHHA